MTICGAYLVKWAYILCACVRLEVLQHHLLDNQPADARLLGRVQRHGCTLLRNTTPQLIYDLFIKRAEVLLQPTQRGY